MSRDLTPKELDYLIQQNNLPNLTESLTITYGDKTMPAYNDEQIAISKTYARIGRFGFDMLMKCRNIGMFSSDEGKATIQSVEDYFNGKELKDKEFANKIELWYNGEFSPGYYMENNDEEFAEFLKQYSKKEG